VADPVDDALSLQLQLVKAMRRVRQACPKWWSEERVQEAMGRDSECLSLKSESDAAWSKLGAA
jgi:hypothetical protein